MAKRATVNQTPATGSVAMWQLIDTLIDAGWDKVADSDGTTYSDTGAQVTSGASGAGGLGNTNAYVVLRDPGAMREYCIQRGSSDLLWRVKYSALDRFVESGTPETQVPAATDEVVLCGTGSDASPTGATVFATNGTYYFHCVAMDAPAGSDLGSGYDFFAWSADTGTGTLKSLFFGASMEDGSFPEADSRSAPTTGDADPYITAFAYSATSVVFACGSISVYTAAAGWLSATTTNLPARGWFMYNRTGETAVQFEAFGFAPDLNADGSVPANRDLYKNLGTNPYTSEDVVLPLLVGRSTARSTQVGLKGVAKYIRSPGSNRAYPTTYNLSTDAWILVGDLLLPWPNGVTPSV